MANRDVDMDPIHNLRSTVRGDPDPCRHVARGSLVAARVTRVAGGSGEMRTIPRGGRRERASQSETTPQEPRRRGRGINTGSAPSRDGNSRTRRPDGSTSGPDSDPFGSTPGRCPTSSYYTMLSRVQSGSYTCHAGVGWCHCPHSTVGTFREILFFSSVPTGTVGGAL